MAANFIDNSDQARQRLNMNAERALTKAALLIVGKAKANVRSRGGTGELRDKINYQIRDNVAVVGSPLHYAIYQEFGTGEFAENGAGRKGGWAYKDQEGKWHYTRGVKPQKFLRNAFRDNSARVQAIFAEELGRGL